jgi:SAM-dependent methyltransferase
MEMESSNQLWAQHTVKEVDFIVECCSLNKNSKITDFGCGIGRHTNELLKRGYTNTVGIDYSKTLLEKAKITNETSYILGDCRDILLHEKSDIILCLYDVIGSFIDNTENMKIINNIFKNLSVNGLALISVMNFELTKARAIHTFSLQNEHNKLLDLAASNTMQKTGNVFDPDYYMIDNDTNIVYRREQFTVDNQLPQELIVRDYRFTKDEIEQMCINAGFEIIFSRYVQAGRWDMELDATDSKSKEILLLCKK